MITSQKPRRETFPRTPVLLPAMAALLLLSACATVRCPAGAGQAMRIYDLYFGRSIPGQGEVTEKQWLAFRDRIITPALPEGYTVLDGQGAWMNPKKGVTIMESTKILNVALPDKPESQIAINRIRRVWQTEFNQYSVGMTVQLACGSFTPAEAQQ